MAVLNTPFNRAEDGVYSTIGVATIEKFVGLRRGIG